MRLFGVRCLGTALAKAPPRRRTPKEIRICVICGSLCGTLFDMRLVVFLLALLLFTASIIKFDNAGAQTTRPTLISHSDSTRAIAFDSVTQQREPFSTAVQI